MRKAFVSGLTEVSKNLKERTEQQQKQTNKKKRTTSVGANLSAISSAPKPTNPTSNSDPKMKSFDTLSKLATKGVHTLKRSHSPEVLKKRSDESATPNRQPKSRSKSFGFDLNKFDSPSLTSM